MNDANGETKVAVDVEGLHSLFPYNTGSWNSILFKKNLKSSQPANLERRGRLETFISLNIQENDCVFPYEDVEEHIKAFWKLPSQSTHKITCGMIMLNKKIMFGFCSKKLGSRYMAHAETDLMSALVKAVRTNTLDITKLDSIDVYSTLQPCAMCSTAIHRAVNWLIKQKEKNIKCNVYFTEKDIAMKCIGEAPKDAVNLLSTENEIQDKLNAYDKKLTLLKKDDKKNFLEEKKKDMKHCRYHFVLPAKSINCNEWQGWEKKKFTEQLRLPIYSSTDMRLDEVCDKAIWGLYSTKNWHWHDTAQQFMRPEIQIGKEKKSTTTRNEEGIDNKSHLPKVLRSHSGVVREFPSTKKREEEEEEEDDGNKEETKNTTTTEKTKKKEEEETRVKFYFVPQPQRTDNIQNATTATTTTTTTTMSTTIQTMWQKVVKQNLGIASISPTKKKKKHGNEKNVLASDLNTQCEISQFFLFLPQLQRDPNVVQTFNFNPNKSAKRPLNGIKELHPVKLSKRAGGGKTRRRRKKVFSKKVRTTRKRTKLLRKKFTKKKTKRRKKRIKTRRKRKNFIMFNNVFFTKRSRTCKVKKKK